MVKRLDHPRARRGWQRLAAAGALVAITGSVCAQNVRNDNSPDLLFVLWDPTAQVSYTRNLRLNANQFWVYAQQDAGYSYDYKLDATDPALIAFRAASTTSSSQRWAVFAVDSGPTLSAGDTKVYSTLTQGPDGGVVNPNYTNMTGAQTGDVLAFARSSGDPGSIIGGYNFTGADTTKYVRASKDGFFTSFDKLGSAGYFAGGNGFSAQGGGGQGSFLAGAYDVANLVNKSSWFYYLTNAGSSSTVVVDEFDNLSSNGYWGLSLADNNAATQYRLTFTQVKATTGANSATTPAGIQRAALIDYAASTGPARLLSVDDSTWLTADALGTQVPVSAVPESDAATLLSMGLATLVGLRARRRRRD